MRGWKKTNEGFTLLELLVTLAIGATLTATSLTLYQQTAKTRNLLQSELALQEGSFFIHQVLRQYINQAGYRPLESAPANTSILPVKVSRAVFPAVDGSWAEGSFIQVLNTGFSIRFEGVSGSDGTADNSLVNCLGEGIAEGDIVELQFTIDSGSLLCSSSGSDVELIGPNDAVSIEQFIGSLGVDRNNDGNADIYLSPSDSLLASDAVVALRLSFLLASVDEVQDQKEKYTFNGVENTATDYKIRRESVTSVQLKH